MKNTFRIVAFLEGVSYLFLLFLAVPIKYNMGDPTYVKLLGMPHGLLFIAYLALSYLLKDEQKWERKSYLIILAASVIPFGTFYVDRKYLRK